MNFCKKYFLVFSITCLVLQVRAQITGAKNETKTGVSKDTKETLYREMLNVSYSNDDTENIPDAYFPVNYENAKVIVYLHGNADKYHFNGNEFALMGGSAGAYLAMLYAYGYDAAKQVKTVVDFWGPTDLADKDVRAGNMDADAKVINLLGVSDPKAQICMDASPYYRITKESGVPTILFHGGLDPLVPVSQADKMYQKLLALGIPAQYAFYPDEKHGMRAAAGVDVLVQTLAWLTKYFPAF